MKFKDIEIQKKETIIRDLKEEAETCSDENYYEDETVEEVTKAMHKNKNVGLLIGKGYFGKEFEVREGMEDEAASQRR